MQHRSKQKPSWLFCLAVGILPLLIPAPVYSAPGGSPVTHCIFSLTVSRAENPWRDYTSSYTEEQASLHVPAVPIGPDHTEIPALAEYTYEAIPWLAQDRARRRVVVNERVFSDLIRPNATRLNKGEGAEIGNLKQPSIDPRRLVRFLLQSQIIQTYAHLEANLCLESELNGPEEYRAFFSGTHIYYTNSRHEEHMGFSILWNRQSGRIRIQGE